MTGKLFKRSAKECGLLEVSCTCVSCKSINHFTRANAYYANPPIGALCGSCSTIVWSHIKESSILFELYNPAPLGENYKKFRQAIINKYLSALPTCPVCSTSNFTFLVDQNIAPQGSKATCSKCLKELEYSYYQEKETNFKNMVWWFDPEIRNV